jgi:Spy/CpxP family protein refolding chaperone
VQAEDWRAALRLRRQPATIDRPTDDVDRSRQKGDQMKKFASAVAVTLLGATLAFAQPHEGGKQWGHGGRGGFGQKLAEQLNLTDAQKAQIQQIKKDSYEQNKAFFDQSRATMKAFFDAKQAGDTAKLDTLKPQAEAQRAQMKQLRDAEDAKIAAVLTADQNAKWQQLKAEHGEGHGRHEH